jgi:hypothetical protein
VKKLMPRPDGFRDPAPITSPVRGLLLVRTKGGYFVYNPSTGRFILASSRQHSAAEEVLPVQDIDPTPATVFPPSNIRPGLLLRFR